MIKSIHISNYALIDKVEIDLTDGLNIITGETGAGKSIMLGALSLLLGARADTKVVTDQSKKSVVETVIEIQPDDFLREFFHDNSLDWSPDNTIILRREINPNSRSRNFINDTPVTLAVLEQLSKQLIDIHSQHQNLLLADPGFQLRIVDSLADDAELLASYRKHYNEYRSTLRDYNHARKALETTRARENELRAQLQQFEHLNLSEGEQEELEREKEKLENFNDIKDCLNTIAEELLEGDNPAVAAVKRCVRESEEIKDLVEDGNELFERLNSTYLELVDIAESFASMNEDMSDEPQRLEFIQSRLNAIYKLQKKYGVNTVEDLLKIATGIETHLDALDDGENRLADLQNKAKEMRAVVLDEAKRLSAKRREVADKFIADLVALAAPLGMKNIKAVVEFNYTQELTPDGIDHLEFKFAFNKNQQPLSIGSTASGGEISRLMLCVKTLLAHRMQFPTIIFDEVDTGVSGEIADKMGAMMLEISNDIQVLAITHLPQVAAKGHTHFKVYKEDDENSTHTRLQRLSASERIREIAVMLSGSQVNEASLANAKSLLNQK